MSFDWEIFTIFWGVIAASSALGMSLFFIRSPRGIAQAVAIDKFAEFVNMAVIVTFAWAYYRDWFVVMPLWGAALLRMTAVVATLFSSIHLGWQVWNIERQEKDGS